MSVTVASNRSPLSRIQSLTAPPANNPVGGMGAAAWAGKKDIRGGLMGFIWGRPSGGKASCSPVGGVLRV